MSIDKVKISIGKTINIGNYESYRVDIGVEASISPSETFNCVYGECLTEVYTKLRENIKFIENKYKEK